MAARYRLPHGMRYSNLNEREQFYSEEFDVEKVRDWLAWSPQRIVFAAVIGRHTQIYPAKYRDDASTTIIIKRYRTLEEVRERLVELSPESAYYDRNLYNDSSGEQLGQELAFDLDPENIVCPVHGSLEEKMKRHQGLAFCKLELHLVKNEAIRLYETLQKQFSSVKIVYSGRGYHLHVLDKEALRMSYNERLRLAKKIKAKNFPIDEWVTSGGVRLIRLPYSLHGMVSRIVTPVAIEEMKHFNPITDSRCIPKFLKD